jgi:hypothetical protein
LPRVETIIRKREISTTADAGQSLANGLGLPEESFVHCLEERFVSNLAAHRVRGFGIPARDVAQLVFAVRGRFVRDLGNLVRGRVRRERLRIG